MANEVGTWLGVLLAIAGIAFAVYQHSQRIRVEKVSRDTLRRLAGTIRVIHLSANWADSHLRNAGKLLAEVYPELPAVKKEIVDGCRDATACARQLAIAHSQIRGIQQTLFADDEEIAPDIGSK